MSISDIISNSYTPKQTDEPSFTIEEAAKEIFERVSKSLIEKAKAGDVVNNGGLFNKSLYVYCFEALEINDAFCKTPGYPRQTFFNDYTFDKWQLNNKKDLKALVRAVKRIAEPEGIIAEHQYSEKWDSHSIYFKCKI